MIKKYCTVIILALLGVIYWTNKDSIHEMIASKTTKSSDDLVGESEITETIA